MNDSNVLNKDLTAPPAEPQVSASLQKIIASYQERGSRIRERLQSNRGVLLTALKEIGATSVIIYYSGSGDSGQIDQVIIKNGKENLKAEKKISIGISTSHFTENKGWVEKIESREFSLEEALEQFVYDWTESEHPGWENNDGASGECNIEVHDDAFSLEHVSYYTESETTEHSL